MKHHGLPASASQMREALGEDFVEDFSRRLEKVGVDVIRVPDLSTAYSVVLMERPVVVVPTTGNWFYTNWSIAHELGHLALGHEGATPDNRAIGELEAQANAFAADLLLPRVLLDRVDWSRSDFASVARFLWDSIEQIGRASCRESPLPHTGVSRTRGSAGVHDTKVSSEVLGHTGGGPGHPPHDRVGEEAVPRLAEDRTLRKDR